MDDDTVKVLHQQLMEAVGELKHDIKGVHARLDVLNGRTRNCEMDVAVLKERNPGAVGGIAGTVGGAIGGAIAHFFK